MKALILAAGKGSRLGAASGGVPKPLTAVGDTSPLEHALAWVVAERPERIWINVHEHAELIRARMGAHVAGVAICYSYEPQLLGTAGAWKKLAEEWTTTSLVVYGDNLMRFDLSALRAAHEHGGAVATLAVFDPERHANTGPGGGRVAVRGGRAVSFVEGGEGGLINAGVYLFEPELAPRLAEGFLDFGHDVLPHLARAGELVAHVVEHGAYCMGVDTPQKLARARSMVARLQELAS